MAYYCNGVRVTLGSTNTAWKGKRIAFIGDSFSAPGVWQADVATNFEAVCDNHSISGGGWCNGRTKTVYQLAQEITTAPNIIVITIGLNDCNNDVSIGTWADGTSVDDYSDTTFIGGMQKALTYIMNRFVGIPIFIGYTPASGMSSNEHSVENYVAAMKTVCRKFGCIYIDTFGCSMGYPVVQANSTFRAGTTDIHPSTSGQHRIGEAMTDILNGYAASR